MRIFAGGAHRPLRGMPARALREVGGRGPPTTPSHHWQAEGRPTRRPKAAPPSAEEGGRRPPSTPSFDRFAVERPKRGLTNERGPSLETPAPLKPAVTLATGPRARHDSRPWPPASRTHGAASAACNLSTTPQERGCSGVPARDVSADRRIRAERARGRGPGPAVVPGPGTYSATEWAGARGLLDPGRSSARAFGAPSHRLKAWVPNAMTGTEARLSPSDPGR
jgi:hypothetical protein